MAKKAAGVSFTPENHAFVSIGGDISAKVNEIIDKVRSGQWLDAAAQAAGKKQLQCLFNMRDTTSLDAACPVMLRHEDLATKDRLGDLLQCCRQCPRKAEYLLALKTGRGGDKPAASTEAKPVAVLDFDIRCQQDFCDKLWQSRDFADRKQPLFEMHHAIAAHFKLKHGLDYVPREKSPFEVDRKMREEMQQA